MRKSIILAAMLTMATAVWAQLPRTSEVMATTERVADHFIAEYPDVGAKSYVGGKERNSKIWTRGVFYEGMLNAWRENPRADWLKYCTDWGDFHKWISSADNEAKAHNADYQCCGQAYLQMYMMDPSQTVRMTHIKMRIDQMMATERVNYWYWVDAVQMSMPVMAMLGDITGDRSYWTRMNEMYLYTRDSQGGDKRGGGKPLFNTSTGLWYRDYNFDPPYRDTVEKDKDCYWSRGNGWAYMALVRVLQFTPENEPNRDLYISDFKAMSAGLLGCQREDGSWNVSLAAPSNFGSAGSEGPEMTGTSLFVGGMAWGVRAGLLDPATYEPAVTRGWASMDAAVHPDGKVGYLQGTGSAPEHGGPITYNSTPDFEDFGVGCWLWGAAEIHALAAVREEEQSLIAPVIADEAVADAPYYDLLGRRVAEPQHGHLYI
ncbi:MAG: glycoside hydrolase family 88 protein, partial [Duncaniella sp.]|nr:glycoside hydrolase family 88 protein [Duncaniella sp.]